MNWMGWDLPFVTFASILIIEILNYGGVNCIASTAPEFYKPDNGVFVRQWLFPSVYGIDKMDKPPFSDDCPHIGKNLDDFEFNQVYNKKQNIIATTYFVSTQTGMHRFMAICDDQCSLEIRFPQYNSNKMLLKFTSWVPDNWSSSKSSEDLYLVKNVRYYLRLLYYGYGGIDFFRVGVRFPDNSEMKPITKAYLWRSMEFYKWNGLLGRYYDSIVFPDVRTLAEFHRLNSAKYPSSPSYHICQSTLYTPSEKVADYFAIMYLGYVRLPKTESYNLEAYINAIGELTITKSEAEKIVITSDAAVDKVARIGSIGDCNNSQYYHLKLEFAEKVGNEFMQVRYKAATDSSYSAEWSGLLQNLIDSQTSNYLPLPEVTANGATAISATVSESPRLPTDDNWIFLNKHKIVAYKLVEGQSGSLKDLTVQGSLPLTGVLSGLKAFTDYCVYIEYFGYVKSNIPHNPITACTVVKTEESAPDAPPGNCRVSQIRSTSFLVRWNFYTNLESINGVCVGYELRYAIKDASPKNWTSRFINSNTTLSITLTDMEENTEYDVIVAGRTKKGSGVFSTPITVKTNEDKPSAPPSNIMAQNTSSSSIFVSWDDVPYWHQNGIITEYMVYWKKADDSSAWSKKATSSKSLAVDRLELWEFYDIKLSAFTSQGEGPASVPIRVRTDEDKPGEAPAFLEATAVSSSAINVTWKAIQESRTYGNIISYMVKYQRSDGDGTEKEFETDLQSALISGLDFYRYYDIRVAGRTIKGYGPFTETPVKERTLQHEPTSPPVEVNGYNISSTAIEVKWKEIPIVHRNGIITNYLVKYRESKTATKGPGTWKNISILSLVANIADLEYYTLYDITVAGVNTAGIGNYSEIISVRTDADAPGMPPMNLTGRFINHTAIKISWQRVPKPFRFGLIFGYKLHFKDSTLQNAPWKELTIPNSFDGDVFNETIANLKIYTPYKFRIAAYTMKAVGVFSDNITVWTDEHKPEEPPKNVTAQNASSTSFQLNWNEMEEVHEDANGEVLGYIIKYRVLDCHKDRPAGCDENEVFNITSFGKNSTITISHLRKFTRYQVSIQVFNSKGTGNFSKTINVTTDEDKPDATPTLTESWPSTVNSIKVFWSPIPESLRNGIILGYRIFYKPINVPLHRHERAPRAVDPLAVYGALPGEKMKEVNSTTYSTELTGLEHYNWYSIRIGAFTSKGLGFTYTLNGTCKQSVPTAAPHLTLIDEYDFYEISLTWTQINESDSHGEVLGNRILYWLVELNYQPAIKFNVVYFDVYEPIRKTTIHNLRPFATYAIQIQSFTEAGFGVKSKIYYGETCKCPKILSSSFMSIAPLVNRSANGLMSQIVNDAIVSCCGNCSRGHGQSKVDWLRDGNNASAFKYTQKSLRDAALNGTHLVLPFFQITQSIIEDASGSLTYVPIADVTKMLVFHKNIPAGTVVNFAQGIVADAVWQQYPLLLISLLLTMVAGILFWVFESRTNKDEFSDVYFRGSASGIWLAYITMTTVGYGDLTPVTKLGRIHAIVWMLFGLVLVSLIVGNLSSILTINFVLDPVSIDLDEKVLVSDEDFMLAARFFGRYIRIGNTSDGELVARQLTKGISTKTFIDPFKATSISTYLDSPMIRLDELKDVQASYGILLSGELRQTAKCVQKYVSENNDAFLRQLSASTAQFKIHAAPQKDLIDSMLSTDSDTFQGLIHYGGYILVCLIFIGTMYEILKFCRGRMKISSQQYEADVLFPCINEDVGALENRINTMLDAIEARHVKERLQLDKLQFGTVNALMKMYPDLSLFDNTMPNHQENRATEYIVNNDAESSDDEEDGEVYYKRY